MAKADKQTITRGRSRLERNPNASRFTGKVKPRANDRISAAIDALSFVKKRTGRDLARARRSTKRRGTDRDAITGTLYWAATRSGDTSKAYAADCAQGREWARQLLELSEYEIFPVLVGWIVCDIIKAGDVNGLVIGFISTIADAVHCAPAGRKLIAVPLEWEGGYLRRTTA